MVAVGGVSPPVQRALSSGSSGDPQRKLMPNEPWITTKSIHILVLYINTQIHKYTHTSNYLPPPPSQSLHLPYSKHTLLQHSLPPHHPPNHTSDPHPRNPRPHKMQQRPPLNQRLGPLLVGAIFLLRQDFPLRRTRTLPPLHFQRLRLLKQLIINRLDDQQREREDRREDRRRDDIQRSFQPRPFCSSSALFLPSFSPTLLLTFPG